MLKIFHFHFVSWPFNEKTPLGYFCQSSFQFVESYSWLITNLTGLSLLFGSCFLFTSFAEDITNDLNMLNIARKSKRNSKKVKQNLCGIVKAFSEVKELSWFETEIRHAFSLTLIFNRKFYFRLIDEFNAFVNLSLFSPFYGHFYQ